MLESDSPPCSQWLTRFECGTKVPSNKLGSKIQACRG
jgi:hypothetical protein